MKACRSQYTTSAIYEWTANPIPKTEKIGACSLYHLDEAHALLSNLLDHNPHEASPKKHYREPKSDETGIEIGIKTETLWTQFEPRTTIKW